MDYATLSLVEVAAVLEGHARDARATFGHLDERQLNWRPGAAQWSIAQCCEHLLAANRLMMRAAEDALSARRPTLWQRMPVLPGILGRALIRSQSPGGTRKFAASPKATPTHDIAADIIGRFVEQHREAVARVRALDESVAAQTIMTSPFLRVIVYSVRDGWRLIAAHDRRHLEQARRVLQHAGFART
jgi:hypothetical protein